MSDHIAKDTIRKAVVADAFYTGNPHQLAQEIDTYLAHTTAEAISGEIVGLISPHAGYMYSGQVAAEGYKQVQGRNYSVVTVIAPSHYEPLPGISVFTGKGYETPFGLVPVDMELAEQLMAQDQRIVSSWIGHRKEHSLEVQLPFLQRVLTDFKLLPLVMGAQDYQLCQMVGAALAKVLQGKKALIVGSTDLSHFYPYEIAVRLDRVVIERVKAFDVEGLSRELESRTCEACGGGPMMATMIACRQLGADSSSVLRYMNSGDVIRDRREVVGYLSAALYKKTA
ncbi:MAG: AmmeMemoRadiSam system protein B [candidate division KSB1 bacterium]|nr:AmmeMemoRadiSam system protein B [candidate division KSB1 bacterium]